MNAKELSNCCHRQARIMFAGFDGKQYHGRIVAVANGVAHVEYRRAGQYGEPLTAYLERKSWDRLTLAPSEPSETPVEPLEEWTAISCAGMLMIEVRGVKPVAAVLGLYERREECLRNAALICAAQEMRRALERIESNAAESPEWIRRTAGEGLAKLKGGAL
jgi:hypothetical protein